MTTSARFRAAYAERRAAEGRGTGGDAELLALPYLRSGPLAGQWRVRARTYERFLDVVVTARVRELANRTLRVLDLGAGNAWLCYRLVRQGHDAVALDWRRDSVDGLGAATPYSSHLRRMFPRIAASFESIPIRERQFDIVVFNAAIHYAVSLERALAEAARVSAPGGRIAILDSPFYRRASDGDRMVTEKRLAMEHSLGPKAVELLALPSIEYLTSERLARASVPVGLSWRRHRVRYPLGYELRAISARVQRRRAPSRFDLWEAVVP